MLENGPYPEALKRRIRGPGGHLSNDESAALVHAGSNRLQWSCLCHLSEENNHPDVALETHREYLTASFPIHIASRHEATDVLRVE
jgi:phosphoribosyl 1,2-cyclic phosphodiesterase